MRTSVIAFAATGLLLSALAGDRGVTDVRRAQRDYARLNREIEDLRRANAALQQQIERLQSDPAAIEALARKELGLLRKDERLFIVRDAPER